MKTPAGARAEPRLSNSLQNFDQLLDQLSKMLVVLQELVEEKEPNEDVLSMMKMLQNAVLSLAETAENFQITEARLSELGAELSQRVQMLGDKQEQGFDAMETYLQHLMFQNYDILKNQEILNQQMGMDVNTQYMRIIPTPQAWRKK